MTYDNLSQFIRMLKDSNDFPTSNKKIIHDIVKESDIIPEEDKEYILEYMSEEEENFNFKKSAN